MVVLSFFDEIPLARIVLVDVMKLFCYNGVESKDVEISEGQAAVLLYGTSLKHQLPESRRTSKGGLRG